MLVCLLNSSVSHCWKHLVNWSGLLSYRLSTCRKHFWWLSLFTCQKHLYRLPPEVSFLKCLCWLVKNTCIAYSWSVFVDLSKTLALLVSWSVFVDLSETLVLPVSWSVFVDLSKTLVSPVSWTVFCRLVVSSELSLLTCLKHPCSVSFGSCWCVSCTILCRLARNIQLVCFLNCSFLTWHWWKHSFGLLNYPFSSDLKHTVGLSPRLWTVQSRVQDGVTRKTIVWPGTVELPQLLVSDHHGNTP